MFTFLSFCSRGYNSLVKHPEFQKKHISSFVSRDVHATRYVAGTRAKLDQPDGKSILANALAANGKTYEGFVIVCGRFVSGHSAFIFPTQLWLGSIFGNCEHFVGSPPTAHRQVSWKCVLGCLQTVIV